VGGGVIIFGKPYDTQLFLTEIEKTIQKSVKKS